MIGVFFSSFWHEFQTTLDGRNHLTLGMISAFPAPVPRWAIGCSIGVAGEQLLCNHFHLVSSHSTQFRMAAGILPSSRISTLLTKCSLSSRILLFPLILWYIDNLKSALRALTNPSEYSQRIYPERWETCVCSSWERGAEIKNNIWGKFSFGLVALIVVQIEIKWCFSQRFERQEVFWWSVYMQLLKEVLIPC